MIEILEREELLNKLIDAGYGEFIETLLSNESKAYTKKGRLNKSGAYRLLQCKAKFLEDTLLACYEIIKDAYE